MHYQGTTKGAREIGHELGAEYILTGSVQRDMDHVRITAHLIRAEDGTSLWAKDYDRSLSDILALQNEVATAIAREISLKLSPEENARLTAARPIDPVAYENYLKGRYFWDKRTAMSYVKAIEYFNEALARDPQYAQAYTGLADAYALLGSLPNTESPRREAMPKAKAAALTALQLDDSLAEAHTSLAFEEMHYEWDWPAAEREFKRALQLNPNYATAHQWYAIWFVGRRGLDQALAQLDLAEKADPLSLVIKADRAEVLNCVGRYEQSVQVATRALELDPNFVLAHYALAEGYIGQQRYPEAVSEFQKVMAGDSGNIWARAAIARVYAQMGQRATAERLLKTPQRGYQGLRDWGRLFVRDLDHLHHSRRSRSGHRMAGEGLSSSRRCFDFPQYGSDAPATGPPLCRARKTRCFGNQPRQSSGTNSLIRRIGFLSTGP